MKIGMKTHDLGNNESVSEGIRKHRGEYLALTSVSSKWFKTERGATRWLATWGLNPDGTPFEGKRSL